jgi:hypothetical protein
VRGSRSGLASHRVAPIVLSGAALGHDRVRDGTGWGQHALGHGHPPPSTRRKGYPLLRHHRAEAAPGPRSARPRALQATPPRPAIQRRASGGCPLFRDPLPLARAAPRSASDPGGTMGQDLRPRPLGRLGSSRLPAVHLPPINPVICRGSYLRKSGDARLGEGFPLRCFQRFARPHVATQRCRSRDNWHTSGASTPVLSY